MLSPKEVEFQTRFDQLMRRHIFALAIKRDESVSDENKQRAQRLKNKINTALSTLRGKANYASRFADKQYRQEINFEKAKTTPTRPSRSDGLPTKLIGNVVIGEVPFEMLEELYGGHHRIEVFLSKGMTCVHPNCNKTATRAILTAGTRRSGKTGKPSFHLDLFTDDLEHMNVDHIIPLSKKGPDTLANKQPMCAKHNSKKGATIPEWLNL